MGQTWRAHCKRLTSMHHHHRSPRGHCAFNFMPTLKQVAHACFQFLRRCLFYGGGAANQHPTSRSVQTHCLSVRRLYLCACFVYAMCYYLFSVICAG